MDRDDYNDIDELSTDAAYKNYITPAEIMDFQLNVVHNGNWKTYLASIEWDDSYVRESKEEMVEQLRKIELEKHPFKKYF